MTTILESLTTQSQICYAAERQNTQHQQPRDKGSALKLLAETCCSCDVHLNRQLVLRFFHCEAYFYKNDMLSSVTDPVGAL